MLGRAARLGFDRQRERFDRGELHVHRAARLVLLLAQPRDDRVVAAEDQVERHREHARASRTSRARRPPWRRRRAPRRPGSSARSRGSCAARSRDDRLPRRERDGAGDERRVDEEVERRHDRRGAHQRREARGVAAHHGGRAAGRRSTTVSVSDADAEDDAVQRVAAAAGAQRALRPGARPRRCRRSRPGRARTAPRSSPRARARGSTGCGRAAARSSPPTSARRAPSSTANSTGVVEAQLHRRDDHERCGAGQHHGRHVGARADGSAAKVWTCCGLARSSRSLGMPQPRTRTRATTSCDGRGSARRAGSARCAGTRR